MKAKGKKRGTTNFLVLAGLSAVAFGGIALGFVFMRAAPRPAVAQPDQPPASVAEAPSETVANTEGVWWTGEMGVTETVDQIMARDAQEITPPFPTEAEAEEKEYPDRSNLPQDPDSPAVSQWPPSDQSGIAPTPVPQAEGYGSTRGGNQPYLPQTAGTSFLGVGSSESGYIPPDSMGAVGPTQFLVCVNGRIKVFSKAGVLGSLNTTTNSFFTSVRNGSTTSDPKVRFDRLSQRWFVSMINTSSPNRFLLAVSSGATITGTSSFTFYYFQQDQVTPTGDTGALLDYPSLGIDSKGVYTGGNMFTSGFLGSSVFVILKSSVLSGGPIVATAFRNVCTSAGVGCYSPQGVDNDDPASDQGFFIGVSGNTLGQLVLRRISNVDTTPTISVNILITVPSTAPPAAVTVLGSGSNPLAAIDDRLMNGKMRLNRLTGVRDLWTQHSIAVNSSGVAGGDRNAVRWYEVEHVNVGYGPVTLVQAGTLYSSAASNPDSYWMGDCNTSGQGHMAVASTVGGAARRAEIAAAGRLGTDALGTLQAPTTLQTSSTNYNVQSGEQRWGDYSMTTVDPTDDMTMWTIQEYCNSTNSWGCRVTQLKAPPPATPASCSPATVSQGDTNVDVVVTGTSASGSGFFDPGTEFPNHLTASVGGSGVTVNSVTFTDPTHFTINVTVAGGAALGARTVTATNPDAQVVSSAGGILTVSSAGSPPSIDTQPQSQEVCSGASVTFTVSASGTAPLSYQWRKNTVNIGGANSSSYTINPVGLSDAAAYDCVVTNGYGSATSNAATLTVDTSPTITTDPNSQTVAPGASVTFTVAASGTAPLSYQWRKGGSNIGGATSSSYTINPVTAGDAGSYDCVVTNLCGSATSNAATLTVSSGGLLGDMNCDGVVNNQDIDPFVLALFNPAGYAAQYPNCNILNGDFTGDGHVNNQDIDGFVAALFAP